MRGIHVTPWALVHDPSTLQRGAYSRPAGGVCMPSHPDQESGVIKLMLDTFNQELVWTMTSPYTQPLDTYL